MDASKPKCYQVIKRVNEEAKVIGLFYNTFFVFVIIAAIIVMAASGISIIAMVISWVFVGIIYFVLLHLQTKLGLGELNKRINYFTNPINFIKITKAVKKII